MTLLLLLLLLLILLLSYLFSETIGYHQSSIEAVTTRAENLNSARAR